MDSFSIQWPLRSRSRNQSEGSFQSQAPEVTADCPLDLQSDTQLMELFRNGSKESMNVLYRRYRRLILSISSRILRDHSEAEDIVQDVFLEICNRAELFDA